MSRHTVSPGKPSRHSAERGAATARPRLARALGLTGLVCAVLACAALAGLVAGCGGGITGGGIPPGDPDVLGYVVASQAQALGDQVAYAAWDGASGARIAWAQAGGNDPWPPTEQPVPRARVLLLRGQTQVDETLTDDTGRFAFYDVPTGDYEVSVTPPAGSGLEPQRRQFRHQRGRQTRLVIRLTPSPQGPGGPGAGASAESLSPSSTAGSHLVQPTKSASRAATELSGGGGPGEAPLGV